MARMALLKQAVKETGLTTGELTSGAKSGKYPALRIGGPRGRWFFDLDLLEARIQQLMNENLRNTTLQEPNQIGIKSSIGPSAP